MEKFDFQKLIVYGRAKEFAAEMHTLIRSIKLDRVINDQLKRASLSIVLNIAEGCSRMSNRDRRNFFIISRGSVFECVAILEHLQDIKRLEGNYCQGQFKQLEGLSKMLLRLIKNLS